MEVWILDNLFENVYLIDSFESIVWNESYIGYGDFELYMPMNDYILEITTFVRQQREKELDTFVWKKDSDQVMIIEAIEMSTEIETGPCVLMSGRSLESILERRIIWKQTRITGSFQNGVETLINENVINPEIQDRKIPNFVFERSTDQRILDLTLDKQFTGDNLYESIATICEPIDLGFRVRLVDQNKLYFGLYLGQDRSYDQTDNPYVIFSPKFDNLVSSNLLEDVKEFKTITLISGEDEGHERRTTTVGYGAGMKRRELFTDARDIQSEIYTEDGEVQQVPDEEYFANLRQRGTEKLSECKFIKTFEGEIETILSFKYREDFFKGDIVQVETEYGVMSRMRIMQLVETQDSSGHSSYPVFKILE